MFRNAEAWGGRTAVTANGVSYTYNRLLRDSGAMANRICQVLGTDDLNEAHIGFLADPGYEYTVMQWAVWRSGGCAVPLCNTHPEDELEYTLTDSECALTLATPSRESLVSGVANKIGRPFELITTEAQEDSGCAFPELPLDRRAMIIYTSGTTGRPKGNADLPVKCW